MCVNSFVSIPHRRTKCSCVCTGTQRFKGLLLHIVSLQRAYDSFKMRDECAVAEGAKTKLISLKRRVTHTHRSIHGLVHGVDSLRVHGLTLRSRNE